MRGVASTREHSGSTVGTSRHDKLSHDERARELRGRGDERCNIVRIVRIETIQKWIWAPEPFFYKKKKTNNIDFSKKLALSKQRQHQF